MNNLRKIYELLSSAVIDRFLKKNFQSQDSYLA